MKKHAKLVTIGIIAVVIVCALAIAFTNYQKEQKAKREAEEAARRAAEAKQAAEEYQAQANAYMEEEKYDEAQNAMEQALAQTPEDEALQQAADELHEKAEEMKGYIATMEQAIAAIEADDAEALDRLQDSENGRQLAEMAEKSGSYIYLPEGGSTGKGIGFYTFSDCSCDQWYYGDYVDGKREGKGIWYYTSSHTEEGKLYKDVYDGEWSNDAPNGKGHQLISLGDEVDTDQKFKVKDGLFYGSYKIKDTLEDGTAVSGKYKLKEGKYVTISDEELEKKNFVVPKEPHLAIAFLRDEAGEIRSCTMIYAKDTTKGVKHFYPSKQEG